LEALFVIPFTAKSSLLARRPICHQPRGGRAWTAKARKALPDEPCLATRVDGGVILDLQIHNSPVSPL
jgi:hypothetical protein